MALHDSLRDLVEVRGAGVVDDADEFRGVLDDFLAEDEATLGELNLLVDAVRLGALRRVLDVLPHGADPEAAVREAGAALARDRGTDDPTRSCWALATLGFALGKIDEAMVRKFRGDAGTMPAPTPAPGPAPGLAPGPAPGLAPGSPPSSADDGTHLLPEHASAPTSPPPPPPVSQPVPTPDPSPTVEAHAAAPPPQHPAPLPPVIPEERPSRAGVFLLVVLVALLLGGLIAAGVILLRSDPDGSGEDDTTATDTPTSDRGGDDPPLISEDEMLVPYEEGETSIVYVVDVMGGGYRALTEGPRDGLPTIAPDRRTVTFDTGPRPLTLQRWDLENDTYEPFFPEDGPCAHALRPGWSFDGKRVALVCTGDDDVADGIYVAGADGSDPRLVVDDPLVAGSPTWVSDTEFVFGIRSSADRDEAVLTFRRGFADGRPSEPFDVGVTDSQITHIDWSREAGKLLFLVSPFGGEEIGSVWTVNADGSDAQVVAEGSYAHPVWSPDGRAIGATVFTTPPTSETEGVEELCYLPLGDDGSADAPVIVTDPPPGDVGIPVWGTR